MASKYLIYKNRKNEFKKLLDRAVKLDIVSAFVSRNDIFNDTIERAKDGKLTVRLLAGISNAISDPDVLLKKLLTLWIFLTISAGFSQISVNVS